MDKFCPIFSCNCSKISSNSLLTNWCYFNEWTECAINPFWISMFMYILNKQILVENESGITRFICLQSILSDWMVCDMEHIPNKMKHLSETLSVRELFKFICKLCLCVFCICSLSFSPFVYSLFVWWLCFRSDVPATNIRDFEMDKAASPFLHVNATKTEHSVECAWIVRRLKRTTFNRRKNQRKEMKKEKHDQQHLEEAMFMCIWL